MTTQESKTEAGTPQDEAIQKLASLQHDIIEEEVESRCKARFAAAQEQLYTDKQALREEKLEWEMSRQKAIDKLEEERELLASAKLDDMKELEKAAEDVSKREAEVNEHNEAARRATADLLQEHIRVNVGGKIFDTTTKTLSSMSPYFTRLLSGTMKEPMKDPQGNVFVDRKPEGFETFIEYARQGCRTNILKRELQSRRQKDKTSRPHGLGLALVAFTEEMAFYGISADPVDERSPPELKTGTEVAVWWMRQREMFRGAVILSFKTVLGSPMVWIKYVDKEIWLYSANRLWYRGSPHLERFKSNAYRSQLHSDDREALGEAAFIHYGTALKWPESFTEKEIKAMDLKGHLPPGMPVEEV